MRHGSHSIVAVFLLATALTLAQEDAGYAKLPASLLPPAPFVTTPASTSTHPKTTPSHKNITTVPPTTHHTTANVTTVPPTTHHTTANVTTVPPTTHNTTANVTTVPPTTHNTTANVTTVPPTTHNTTANVTSPPPTTHNGTTPNTTTPSTTTSHTVKPEPTPKTNVTVGNYTVKDGNKLCVMVQAAIQFRVNYSQVAGNYIVPGDAKSTGSCERNTASLNINLKEGYITMNFSKNDTSNVVFVSAVAVNLTYAFKTGTWSHVVRKNDSVQLFSVATSHSYSCKSESVFLGDGAYLEFSQNRLQAFNFTNNQFGQPDLCKADQPDYRVAIGVGVVLIILIIIVVVAYLISRRRRTDGYQTL